jgi:hypothetical protein
MGRQQKDKQHMNDLQLQQWASELPFFSIGGAVTFALGPWSSLLRRIPDNKMY